MIIINMKFEKNNKIIDYRRVSVSLNYNIYIAYSGLMLNLHFFNLILYDIKILLFLLQM